MGIFVSCSFDKNMYKCLYTLRYDKAKADYESNLKNRRQKLYELFDKESALLDQVSLKIEEDRKLRREQLKEEIEEVRKLREIECKELAEAGYRKQKTMNRDNYRLMLNKLYAQDLNAQIELNKQIEAHENGKEEGMPKMVSLPVGFDCENGDTRFKRSLNEELQNAMSARGAKLSEIARQKKEEAEEMRKHEEIRLREKAEADKAAYERKTMLRNSFEQRIKEKNQELERKRVEDARTSAWLTSNAIQQTSAIKEKSLHDKVIAKQRALALFEYAKQLEKEKQLEEKRRERAMERMAGEIMEANEAKQKQLREASRALEKETRQAQLKQMQEKEERSTVPTTSGGPSFLDKMLAEGDRMVDGRRTVRQEKSRELQQPTAQKPQMTYFTDWGMEDREFTRPHQRSPEGDLDTYEYLNPLRKLPLQELAFKSRIY
ncbi:unnamed protein product [Taenia asiatica]|uniref:TPH domain-containing protein n=1 Tax=Taenia asiatica TaxID=60517 RepID=A0A0R3W0Z4_TAEAS|nr:unnamed protein product [Taenia asiatica]